MKKGESIQTFIYFNNLIFCRAHIKNIRKKSCFKIHDPLQISNLLRFDFLAQCPDINPNPGPPGRPSFKVEINFRNPLKEMNEIKKFCEYKERIVYKVVKKTRFAILNAL